MLRLASFISIPKIHYIAGLNSMSPETFGVCIYRPMTGTRQPHRIFVETSRERVAAVGLRLRLSDLTPSMPEDPRLKEPPKNDAGMGEATLLALQNGCSLLR